MAVVQSKSANIASSVTFTSSTTTGNKIIVAVWSFLGDFAAGEVTDSKSNTYTIRAVNNSVAVKTAIYESQDSPTMGASHQVNVASGVSDQGLVAFEVSGLDTTPFDKQATGVDSSSPAQSSATATLAQADEWCVCVNCMDTGNNGTITATSGTNWNVVFSDPDGTATLVAAVEEKTVAATTAVTGSFDVTHASFTANLSVATFKIAAGGGGVTGTVAVTLGAFTSSASGTVPPILMAPAVVTVPPTATVSTY